MLEFSMINGSSSATQVVLWFGPMGTAALCYSSYSAQRLGVQQIWTIGSLVVTPPVFVHGLNTTPQPKPESVAKEEARYGLA
ncbi:MAG TPA: hypothetical protein VFO10_28735 [Oligoflexus sp.]|uniref:hypothetical protein n=1 Tax=Oligoflexus sp. TaxID=1971216 RepID=UPI002D7E8F08|nr:hypothetical protein [Oligoflexus sp.]HET9241286.1 hypothetical protein [Oligoflexus sp.]